MSETPALAIGWLVFAIGREKMAQEVERAETAGQIEIASQLRYWMNRLARVDNRASLIGDAASALAESAGPGVWEEDEAEKWAEVALRGAGVIR